MITSAAPSLLPLHPSGPARTKPAWEQEVTSVHTFAIFPASLYLPSQIGVEQFLPQGALRRHEPRDWDPMLQKLSGEVREVVWLVSVVGSLSVVGVSLAIAAAMALERLSSVAHV